MPTIDIDQKLDSNSITLQATASVSHDHDEQSYDLQMPDGASYVNHRVDVLSQNRSAGSSVTLSADRRTLHCKVWADYTGPRPFGGPRSWCKATFTIEYFAHNVVAEAGGIIRPGDWLELDEITKFIDARASL